MIPYPGHLERLVHRPVGVWPIDERAAALETKVIPPRNERPGRIARAVRAVRRR